MTLTPCEGAFAPAPLVWSDQQPRGCFPTAWSHMWRWENPKANSWSLVSLCSVVESLCLLAVVCLLKCMGDAAIRVLQSGVWLSRWCINHRISHEITQGCRYLGGSKNEKPLSPSLNIRLKIAVHIIMTLFIYNFKYYKRYLNINHSTSKIVWHSSVRYSRSLVKFPLKFCCCQTNKVIFYSILLRPLRTRINTSF